MQDDVDDVEIVPFGMIGDTLDGLGGYSMAHAFRHVTPRLVRHFIHITVRTRQVTSAVDLQDELTEGDGRVSCFSNCSHIEVDHWPRRRMPCDLG
jgi:hypothetical protein